MSRALVGPHDPPVAREHACDRCGAQYHGHRAARECCSDVAPDGGEVEDDRPRTRTIEREEINVETVEEQELLCPVCEQWYDEDELVPVGLGVAKGEKKAAYRAYFEEDQCCATCAESLFDYDGPAGLFDYVAAEWDAMDWRGVLSGVGSLAIGLGGAGLLLHGFAAVIDAFGSMGPDATEPAAESGLAEVVMSVGEILAPLVILLILISIASSIGPRRM